MNLRTCSLREVQRHPGRTLLTLLGIGIGLAAVAATRLTIDTAHRAYRGLCDSERTALEVTAPGLPNFDAPFARDLEHVPGVRAVFPHVQGVAAVSGSSGSVSVRILGIDPLRGPWPLLAGRPLTSPDDAQISPDLARALDLKPGQTMRLWASTGPAELHLAGILRPCAATAAVGGLLVVPLASARRLFDLPDRVNSVEIVLRGGADPEQVRGAVARLLPSGLMVQAAGGCNELARATVRATEQGLTYLGDVALTAAAFVILNTFLLSLGQRRRQLAILRALGATRAQVTRMLLREALVLGAAGTLAGCVAGVALSEILLHAVGRFLNTDLPGPHLSAAPFVLAGLLGPGTALAVAFVPAWCAARREPLGELLPGRGSHTDSLPRWAARAGLCLLAVSLVLGLGLCLGWLPARFGQTLLAPALVLLLAGGALTVPLAVGPLLRLTRVLPLGPEAQFAGRQLARHPIRTGLTAGILFLALATAIGFGHTVGAIVQDLRQWYGRTIVADFLVRGSMTDTTFSMAAALPESLAGEIARLGPVAAVDRIAFLPALVNGQPVLVLARSFAQASRLPLALPEGTEDAIRDGLMRGEVVLGTALAERLNLHPGDSLTLTTPHGPARVRVVGTASEYAVGGLAMYLEWTAAKRLLDVPGVHAFLIGAAPGSSEALGDALRTFCNRRHLLLQSNAELAALVTGLLGQVTGVLWALMTLTFVVASLGIFNTLVMNVHDQAREFGVLRALGLKRGQVGRMVLVQALLLGGIILLPGAVAGVALAYAISRASVVWSGPPVPFHLDFGVLAVACGLSVTTAALAALLPARRAAQLPVVRALRE
jgi:putative ABC transport system permease protein